MKRKTVLLQMTVTILLLAAFGCGSEEVDTSLPYTADDYTFIMGVERYDAPDQERPDRGETYLDKRFGTRVTRLTDKEADGYSDAGLAVEASRIDPVNSNGSRLVLTGSGGGWYIYDTAAASLEELPAAVDPGEAPYLEPRWDNQDPDILYFISSTALMSFNVATGAVDTEHDFIREFPNAAYITTGSKGDAGLGRRTWCFLVRDGDDATIAVAAYDRVRDSLYGTLTELPGEIDWVSADMSGKHCLVGFEDLPVRAYPKELDRGVELPAGAKASADSAWTSDGRDVLVYQNTETGWIAMADVETGEETPLLEIPFATNPDIGVHISGNAGDMQGWALISTYGAETPPDGKEHSWMDTQMFILELKDSPRIWRVANTQSYVPAGGTAPFAAAFTAIDTSGKAVYFGSNWGDAAEGYADIYRVDLPQGWRTALAGKAACH